MSRINAIRGRKNRSQGEDAQELFLIRLRALGVLMVERIHTPWNIVRHHATRKIITAFPLEKVSGDFRGILPGGRSVLCEVKSCDKLLFSAFDKHQIDALNNHTAAGGLSLVGWKWPDGDSLMTWPIVGFRARTSLSPDQARPANIAGLVMY